MSGRPKRKAVDATAQRAKKARGETDLEWGLRWRHVGTPTKDLHPVLCLDTDALPPVTKAAGFDIDFTVISTKSGRKFATGATDWQWLYPCVPEKLKELHEDGFRIVFFTNQAGIEKMKVKPREIMDKIEAIIQALGVPIFAFVSTGVTHWRKPSTLMWEHFEEASNKNNDLSRSDSLYVGDAAGRAKAWAPGKPRDFSCSDRMFAENLDIKFYTPEEFFLGESPAEFSWGSLNPKEFLAKAKAAENKTYHSKEQEIVVMVGPPASGKSSFSKRYLVPHGYVVVNRDTLNTADKCIKVAEDAVSKGKSVVVDNTSPSQANRYPYVEMANDAGIPIRCFYMQTPYEVAYHLNQVRMNLTSGAVRRVPDVGYNMYKKNFQEPSTMEGFKSIEKIDFSVQFNSDKEKETFLQWTNNH